MKLGWLNWLLFVLSTYLCMLLLKIRDWPVGQHFSRRLYTQFSLARYNMHRLHHLSPWFWTSPDWIKFDWLNWLLFVLSTYLCMLLYKSKDRPVGQRFPERLYTQFGLARCNMHRLHHLSTWVWTSPGRMKLDWLNWLLFEVSTKLHMLLLRSRDWPLGQRPL